MTKTLTPRAAFDRVSETVERIKNDEPATVANIEPGDAVRQGDLYLIALDKKPKTTGPAPSRQLAPGSTQGSRHVAEGDCDVLTVDEDSALAILHRLIPATKIHEQFLGPLVRARGPVTIAHPEHGDRTLPPGTYLVTYQRAFAETIRRQMD